MEFERVINENDLALATHDLRARIVGNDRAGGEPGGVEQEHLDKLGNRRYKIRRAPRSIASRRNCAKEERGDPGILPEASAQ